MPKQTLFRLLSFGAVVAVFWWSSKTIAMAIVVAIGLTHYALSFVYSRRQFGELLKRPASYLPVLMLVPLTYAMVTLDLPGFPFLIFYFGLHNALTETYFMNLPLGKRDAPGMASLAGWRFCWNMCAYVVIMWQHFSMWVDSEPLYFAVLATAILAGAQTVRHVWVLRDKLSRTDFVDQLGFELVLAAFLVISFFIPQVTFAQFVLYHFAIWVLIPIPGLRRKGAVSVANYLVATAALFLAIMALTPLVFSPVSIKIPELAKQLYLWGYIHISASFALSSLNPQWLTRFYLDAPLRASA